MSAHFTELLEGLRRRCLGLGTMVQDVVRDAVAGVAGKNAQAAQGVYEAEGKIDAEEVEIERQAINLLALHQPAAGDLRMIFAIVKINSDLERIADCAVNLGQQIAPYAASGVEAPADMRIMGDAVLKQLQDTLRALELQDPDLAEEVARGDDLLDALNNQLMQELQAAMVADARKVPGCLALLIMARNFERMGDHCVNIAEDVIYRMRGRIVRHAR